MTVVVDTNILLRIVLDDDPDQTERARKLLQSETLWVPTTVFLETHWVLDRVYRLSRERICIVLTGLCDFPTMEMENEPACRAAIALYGQGMDFADALHLQAVGNRRFASFDQKFVKAGRAQGVDVFAP